jgi:hypothetical protein
MFQIVGTKQILRQIQENLIHYVGLSRTKLTKYQRSKNHYALRYSGRLQVVRIMDWLYSGSQWHLNRKYQKYLDVKSIA